MASWEEARRCPRCGTAGVEVGQQSDGGGGKIKVLECHNEACSWGETHERFMVQIRHDGTIPDPEESAGQRAFPAASNAVFGSDAEFEAVREALRAQNNQMGKPEGGETGR
jgi:hypothetical protein